MLLETSYHSAQSSLSHQADSDTMERMSANIAGSLDKTVQEKLEKAERAARLKAKRQRIERLRQHENHMKQEAQWAFEHFTKHFTAVRAQTAEQLQSAYRIRHEVFCEEIKIFEGNAARLECDTYDAYAEQCLIQHRRSLDYSGCVRLIMPEKPDQILPIEKQGLDYIEDKSALPSNFDRNEIAEVSRILIPKVFRKRRLDKAACAESTGINVELYDENDVRCFPFIAVGLYMACTAMFKNRGRKHIYFMADPRLGKSMQVVGLTMKQIGPEFEYVGRRVPYYIDFEDFLKNLKPSFKFMLNDFLKTIN
uniref:PEP-CTERM/exosortase system-associated acyltransferase n=1 Tax=Ningiella ruwaisensis TaxID=2364274 RepID=UPI00109FE846|nr:PEP-CTERM/exosortase system-associated acyltransferase [Ningiella ruwaisensis]